MLILISLHWIGPGGEVCAQQKNVFLNRTTSNDVDLFIKDEIELGDSTYKDVQTGFKPLIESLSTRNKYGELHQEILMTRKGRPDGFEKVLPNTFWNKVWRKINTENLILNLQKEDSVAG